jgi:hypothetical protein
MADGMLIPHLHKALFVSIKRAAAQSRAFVLVNSGDSR